MGTRVIVCILVIGTVALGQTRERGRFSLQGEAATCMGIDQPAKHALIAFNGGTICVFSAEQRVVQVFTFPVHKKTVTSAVFLPDGKQFATVSSDGLLRLWDTAEALKHHKAMEDKNGDAKLEPPKPLHSVQAHSGYGVTCLAVSPDGKRFATGGADGTIKLWEAENLKQLVFMVAAHPGGVKTVQFSPDGKQLASGGSDKTAKVWDVTVEKPTTTKKLEGHEGPVLAVAFNPDGKLLGTCSGVAKKSGSVHIWDVATGKEAYKLEGQEDVATCLVFHPKTDHLATGSADKKIRVWNLKEKIVEYTDEHAEPLRNLVITPDGVRFGSCSDRAVRWWAGFGK